MDPSLNHPPWTIPQIAVVFTEVQRLGCADGDTATWRWPSDGRTCWSDATSIWWRCGDAAMRSVTVSPKEGNAVVQSWERWETMGNHGNQRNHGGGDGMCRERCEKSRWNTEDHSEDLFESLWSFNDQIICSPATLTMRGCRPATLPDIFFCSLCACDILERWIRDELAIWQNIQP